MIPDEDGPIDESKFSATPAQIAADDISDLICRMVNIYSGGTCLCPGDEHGADTTKAFCFKLAKEIADLTAATQVGGPIDYVELIGKREIEWRAAAEDHVDEIEKLKAELAATIERCGEPTIDTLQQELSDQLNELHSVKLATIERCAQVAEQHDYSCDAKDIADAIRKEGK